MPTPLRRSILSGASLAVAVASIAAVFLLAACRPNETVEAQARDAKIKTQIKSKLASDVGAATITAISVDVTNGVVTIAGPVHTEDEKARIAAAARSVEGVVSVNDAMQVQASSPPAATGMTTAPPATPAPTP